ncbi:glycoside hydrolase family 43 protein, partial [Tulasnella calospora MUT 4182]
ADELAQVSEVVSAAAGGGVSIRAVRNAGFFLLVEVDPGFDLEGAMVDANPFSKLPFGAIILTSSRPTSFRPSARFISRMFAPQSGVAEDPVCGSAHCALAPYWSQVLNIPPGEVIEVRQASKRGGDLDLIWEKESGRVRIQGSAVVTMRGELYL